MVANALKSHNYHIEIVLDSQKIIWVDDPSHRHQTTQYIIYDRVGTRGLKYRDRVVFSRMIKLAIY